MIQALHAQMEELQQKGIADQQHNEEDQRRHEEEMSLLKEQNKYLQQRLDGHEWEEQSRAPPPTPQTHQTHSAPQTHPTPQTHQTLHTLQTHQTHQSSRNNPVPDDEEDPRGHPFTDEIIDTTLTT